MKTMSSPSGSVLPVSFLLFAGAFLTTVCGQGLDWPCFHGPERNNISREKGWLGSWPAEGPKRLWKANVGGGFSSVSVAKGRLFTMGVVDRKETVWCLDAVTGKEIWKHSYPYVFKPQYYEGGSSVTPTVDGDVVYSLGQSGEFICFDAATGRIVWTQHLSKDHGFAVPTWGFASSPYVHGDLLILNAGTHGAAFNKTTGKPVWTTGQAAAGYSSAVPFEFGGQKSVAFYAAKEVVAVEAQTGKLLWQHPWKTDWDVNAADPVISGDRVFISSSYGSGCALIQFSERPPRELWRNKDMQSHFNSAVLLDGFLYGVDGEAAKAVFFKCLDWNTGTVKWSQKGLGLGAVTAADGKLIILSEKGELVIAEAVPTAFKPLARAQVLGGKCWTVPVLSHARVYCRNSTGELVCVDAKGSDK